MAKTGSITLLEDLAPLYVVAFDGVPSDAEFQRYLDWMLAIATKGRLHAMVFDATHAGLIPASQRRMQGDWMREHDRLNRETTAACAFVLPNPLLRGTLTAILWLWPMPSPHTVTATRDTSIAFCAEHLRRRGAMEANV